MTKTLCFAALDHLGDEYFRDLVHGIRAFCPNADVYWYDSGERGSAGRDVDVPRLPMSQPLMYGKIALFFLDMFEWAAGQRYDYLVNVESDAAFVRPGYEEFLESAMDGVDHLASRLNRTLPTSMWRPYRSLLPNELPELLSMLGVAHTNECFNVGQVFSTRYIDTLLSSSIYPDLRDFVTRNQQPDRSFALEEVLMPTLSDALGLTSGSYPANSAAVIRYRPYHDADALARALTLRDVYFVHPVRRSPDDAARCLVRSLLGRT